MPGAFPSERGRAAQRERAAQGECCLPGRVALRSTGGKGSSRGRRKGQRTWMAWSRDVQVPSTRSLTSASMPWALQRDSKTAASGGPPLSRRVGRRRCTTGRAPRPWRTPLCKEGGRKGGREGVTLGGLGAGIPEGGLTAVGGRQGRQGRGRASGFKGCNPHFHIHFALAAVSRRALSHLYGLFRVCFWSCT